MYAWGLLTLYLVFLIVVSSLQIREKDLVFLPPTQQCCWQEPVLYIGISFSNYAFLCCVTGNCPSWYLLHAPIWFLLCIPINYTNWQTPPVASHWESVIIISRLIGHGDHDIYLSLLLNKTPLSGALIIISAIRSLFCYMSNSPPEWCRSRIESSNRPACAMHVTVSIIAKIRFRHIFSDREIMLSWRGRSQN